MPKTDIRVKLIGENGNAFVILSAVTRALKLGGRKDLITPFMDEATAGDYDHLLRTAMDYVIVR